MRPVWLLSIALLPLAAGCAENAPEAPDLSQHSALVQGKGAAVYIRFELAEDTTVRYAFRIGEGGEGVGCFVAQGAGKRWAAQQAETPMNVELVLGHGCAAGPEADARQRLGKGPWELAIYFHSCPSLDCRYEWGYTNMRPTHTVLDGAPPRR